MPVLDSNDDAGTDRRSARHSFLRIVRIPRKPGEVAAALRQTHLDLAEAQRNLVRLTRGVSREEGRADCVGPRIPNLGQPPARK